MKCLIWKVKFAMLYGKMVGWKHKSTDWFGLDCVGLDSIRLNWMDGWIDGYMDRCMELILFNDTNMYKI